MSFPCQKPQFWCDICNKSFTTKYILARHFVSIHSIRLSLDTLLPVDGQPPTSTPPPETSSSSLPEPRPSTSGQCPPPPTPASAPPNHQCRICGESNLTWLDLNRHMRSCHFVPGSLMCSYCGKTFSRGQSLSNHLISSCRAIKRRDVAQRQSSTQSTTSDQQVASTDQPDKPFSCPDCNFQTSHGSSIGRHRKSFHKVFPCSECSYIGLESRLLKEHMKRKHEDNSKPECPECGKSFSCQYSLKRHLHVHSKLLKVDTPSSSGPPPPASTPPPESSSSSLAQPTPSTSGQCPPPPPPTSTPPPESSSSSLPQPTPSTSGQCPPPPPPTSTPPPESSSSSLPQPTPSTSGQCPPPPTPTWAPRRYQCAICGKSYIWRYRLGEHMKTSHVTGLQFPTSTPPPESSFSSLPQPTPSTSGQCPPPPPPTSAPPKPKHQCAICGQSYNWRSGLTRHCRRSHGCTLRTMSDGQVTSTDNLLGPVPAECSNVTQSTPERGHVPVPAECSDVPQPQSTPVSGHVPVPAECSDVPQPQSTPVSGHGPVPAECSNVSQSTPGRGHEVIRPVFDEILCMVNYGFETLQERDLRIGALWFFLQRMQDAGEMVTSELRDLRRMAMENLQHYIREVINRWSTIYSAGLESLQSASETTNALLRQATILSGIINKELCSDSSLLEQLEKDFKNIENDPTRIQSFLPNFFYYIISAIQRSEALQRFLACSLEEFHRFMVEGEETEVSGANVLCAPELEAGNMQVVCRSDWSLGVIACHHVLPTRLPVASTSTPVPPPPSTPHPYNDLPGIPPDLSARVQRWIDESCFDEDGSSSDESTSGFLEKWSQL